jgi:hypothetical protein
MPASIILKAAAWVILGKLDNPSFSRSPAIKTIARPKPAPAPRALSLCLLALPALMVSTWC